MSLATLVLAFLVCQLPYCSNYVMHHPDERHYTDGAITMVHTGDYLTPVTADGNYRFHKPVLTYWLVAASYQLLGISPLASRLPFLLVGCGVVVLTYGTAKVLYGCSRVGLLAASIMACHPILILSATRSIPDILLALFMLISAHGFMRILFRDDQRPINYWMAYVGAGMAVAAKGLPAMTFVVFSFGYCLVMLPKRRSALVSHWPSMVTGSALAFAWFVAVAARHGWVALNGFLGDQVGERVATDIWKPLLQYPAFLGLCAVMLLPWSVLFVSRRTRRQVLGNMPTSDWEIIRFVLLWTLFFAVFAALVTKFSTRYVLPVSPLLCIALAGALRRVDQSWLDRKLRRLLIALFVISMVIAFASWQINAQVGWDRTTFVWFCLSIAVALGCLAAGLRVRIGWTVAPLAVSLLVLLPIGFTTIHQLAVPDQGQQIADCLKAELGTGGAHVKMQCKPALAAKVRVCSSGRLSVERIPRQRTYENTGLNVPLVFNLETARIPVRSDTRFVPASKGFQDLDPQSILSGLIRGNLPQILDRQRQHYMAALPKNALVERVARRE